ncbi:N-acetylmuramoyl-L-alanine amidase [Mesobacillus jeotgali]|uniref:N-acetylmuramoyl-L-alanine amidase n=1 Tax=Mesobacillus jeotgali TaxID=129985 RepID=A0ABY9VFG9_9BACI|nr:N-acetylmuramoyl-L-alanine amidase [Mesobacillus jeotgali]WNF22674.1 N-acetylmuramoyl-L-alanine amidase [Mesobacillus jeotgali]
MKVASFGKILLSFLVLFSLIFSFQANSTEAAYTYQAKVNADVLNVRSQPGTAYSIKGKLLKSQVVTVLGQKNGWSRIVYKTTTGWVSSKFLTSVRWTGYVTATNLYLRSAPSGKILGTLSKATSLTVYGKDGSWYKVYVPSIRKYGWVHSSYVSSQKPVIVRTASYEKLVMKVNSNLRKGPGTNYAILSTEPAGTFVDKLAVKGDWIQVRKLNGTIGWLHASLVRDPASVLKGKVIVLDAGHGGYDSGTRGRSYLEKTLTLTSALELAPRLQKAGAKVIFTRKTDVYLSLAQRVNISNYYNSDAFISLHYNAYSPTSTGVMTFYYNGYKDAPLARSIQSSLVSSTKLRNMGARYGNYHVIRENRRPAALVELGFLSNPYEEKLVATSTYQQKAATGIYNGLFMYFLQR